MNKNITRALIIGIAIAIGYFIIKVQVIDRIRLNKDNQLAKAKIVKVEGAANGGPYFVYEFTVEGITYNGKFSEDAKQAVYVGDCYYVEYYTNDPEISRILLNRSAICESTSP